MIQKRPQTNISWPRFFMQLIILFSAIILFGFFVDSLYQAALKHQNKVSINNIK